MIIIIQRVKFTEMTIFDFSKLGFYREKNLSCN
jgi:hypothetical protein